MIGTTKTLNLEAILNSTPFDMSRQMGLQNTYSAITTPFYQWMRPVEGILPGWWTPARDIALRHYWPKSDHVAGALFTIQALMTAMRWKVVARDEAIASHVRQAVETERRLRVESGFGSGWQVTVQQLFQDYHTQDNGMFFLILGAGQADRPLIGAPYTIAPLDAGRCTRTGNPRIPRHLFAHRRQAI